MMLGKRTRPPVKRTTSMTEFTLDLAMEQDPSQQPSDPFNTGGGAGLNHRFFAANGVSPRVHRRNSCDFVETAPFLKSCFLCNRRLVPGRDIYIYKGESAFCSLECRQQQMNEEERKERRSLASKKEAPVAAAGSEVVSAVGGETVAATV
ncbi:hypothetical protein RHGRI_021503 [Rhododendron griersonianum]|uniref:FLZ-type domain-containing protein n=1 Tax=Rhododendron griersonianum TaxID=479676 RepID=A0AAV6JQ33_9ERIC|nr:hypothetical protein RHGRI_021503 [Rhododendron griersonianum]